MVRAVQEAAANGLSFGAPTEAEIEMAERCAAACRRMEMVRLVVLGHRGDDDARSGSRAALPAARKIIKFEGCYHGHADSLLVKAGSGALTFGKPTSAGVPAEIAQHTILVLDYNDMAAVEAMFAADGDEIACVIVEPVAGNMNLIVPQAGVSSRPARVCATSTARC